MNTSPGVGLAIARATAETRVEKLATKLTTWFRAESPRGSGYVDELLARVMPGGWRILGTDGVIAVLVQDRQHARTTAPAFSWMETQPVVRVVLSDLLSAIARAKAVAGSVQRGRGEVVLAYPSDGLELSIYADDGEGTISWETVPVEPSSPAPDYLVAVDPAKVLTLLQSVRDLPTIEVYGRRDLLDLRFMGATRAHRIMLMGMKHDTPPRSVEVWQRATSAPATGSTEATA